MNTASGIDIHEDGHGRDCIVMIHGWPDTYRLWDAQVAALRSRYRCVRFTLPGFEPGSPRRAWGLAEIVDIVGEVVETASPDRPVILMAHDWGCLFGYRFVTTHPTRVSKIIGLDIGDAGSRAHVDSLGRGAKLMTFGYQVWLAAAWRIGGGVGDRMTRFMARQMRVPADLSRIGSHMNYPYYIRWTGTHGSYRDARTFHPAVPMLFVYGKRKPFMFHSPDWASEIDARDDSRVVAMDAGHWMMRDAPERLNEAISAWLAQGTPEPSEGERRASAEPSA